MKNILIINFKRSGDILRSSILINALKVKFPSSHISILIYDEFLSSTKCLSYIETIYTLKRKQIVSLKKNRLFNKAKSINYFFDFLQDIEKVKWDLIVNYSNDLLSAHLVSYFNPEKFYGVKIGTNNNLIFSNFWAELLNEVNVKNHISPLNLSDVYLHMCEVFPFDTKLLRINDDSKYNQLAFEQLTSVRKNFSFENFSPYLVGIQFKTSTEEKDIPLKLINDLIKILLSSKRYYPILLISPDPQEKLLIDELNKDFGNSLITVESDFFAASSVLMNIDFLITPDTAIKHLAILNGLPVLELHLQSEIFRYQGPINSNNLVLTFDRTKLNKDPKFIFSYIKALDIYESLEYFFKYLTKSELKLSSTLTLYESQDDSTGVWYKYVSGKKNSNKEISYIAAKLFIQSWNFHKTSSYLIEYLLTEFGRKSILEWIENEKDHLTKIVYAVLDSIRILKEIKTNNRSNNLLFLSLEEIIKNSDISSFLSIPCSIFKGLFESIDGESQIQKLNNLEKLLLQLKAQIQTCTQILTQIGNKEITQKSPPIKNINTDGFI